jgi:hypothetical protein
MVINDRSQSILLILLKYTRKYCYKISLKHHGYTTKCTRRALEMNSDFIHRCLEEEQTSQI